MHFDEISLVFRRSEEGWGEERGEEWGEGWGEEWGEEWGEFGEGVGEGVGEGESKEVVPTTTPPPPTTTTPTTTDLTFVLVDFNFSQKMKINSDNDMRFGIIIIITKENNQNKN